MQIQTHTHTTISSHMGIIGLNCDSLSDTDKVLCRLNFFLLACEFKLVLAPLTTSIIIINLENAHIDNSNDKCEAAASTYLICISF